MLHIEPFFEPDSCTFSYVVADLENKLCAVIDPVLNYNLYTGRSSTESADHIIAYITKHALSNLWILETHIHADHITAAQYLQQHIGGNTGIGARIVDVLAHWTQVFETEDDTQIDGQQFDYLFADNETFDLGAYQFKVLHTPGHTPACASYVIDGNVFVGDTLFAPKRGTARCDFPGGDAKTMYASIKRLYQLADDIVVYLCHDYPDEGESEIYKSCIGEQKTHNVMLNASTTQSDYIAKRTARDKTLAPPKQIIPAIQSNSRLGNFGKKSHSGKQFIKVPINILGKS